MRAILGAGVNVGAHAIRRHRHALDRLRREALIERFLERLYAEHAIGASAGDGDADFRRTLSDEHTDEGEARSLVAELVVTRLLGDRERELLARVTHESTKCVIEPVFGVSRARSKDWKDVVALSIGLTVVVPPTYSVRIIGLEGS